jgi:hypothetical protein
MTSFQERSWRLKFPESPVSWAPELHPMQLEIYHGFGGGIS